jgi:hypothetical protein
LIILFAYSTHNDIFLTSSLVAHVRKDSSHLLG